jgi:NADH dehydrogenase FAD-containing subunit
MLHYSSPLRCYATRTLLHNCCTAGGTEARSLTKALIASLPGQAEAEGAQRSQLTVDQYMRVKGAPEGSILGIGDAVRCVHRFANQVLLLHTPTAAVTYCTQQLL